MQAADGGQGIAEGTGRARGVSIAAGAAVIFIVGPLLLILLSVVHITQGQADLGVSDVRSAIFSFDGSTEHLIVRHVRLPRVTAGIVAGIALAMSGALAQTVTRNPMASPATLGVNGGAFFAVVLAAIFFPGLGVGFAIPVAFVGGIVAAALVYAVAASVSITPVRLTLVGIAVAMLLAAGTSFIQLMYEEQVGGVFFWGGGSLLQRDWSKVQVASPLTLGVGMAVMVMARPLDVLMLGTDRARSLGQRTQLTRLTAALLAVFLAAVSISMVGPVGFIGLVVPHIIRLFGFNSHRALIIGSAIWGAVILIGADVATRLVASGVNEFPVGGVTAILGAPVLVWLARRFREPIGGRKPEGVAATGDITRSVPFPALAALLVALLIVLLGAGMMLGDAKLSIAEVFRVLTGAGESYSRLVLLDFRLPRLLVGLLAGAALAVSGTLLQSVIRNPLAAPDLMGVTMGAGIAGLIVLIVLPSAPIGILPIAALLGGGAAFLFVYAAAWKNGLSPFRLVLIGVAIAAFGQAWSGLLIAQNDVRVAQALLWLIGSTYARGWDEFWWLLPWVVVLAPLACLYGKAANLLALGDDAPRALGLRLDRTRTTLLAISVALAAAAVSAIGTLAFVGLIAPHAGRLLTGHDMRKLVPVSALLGAVIVVAADTVGRTVMAPAEIPAGLTTSVLGAPYFLWLLWRSRTMRA